MTKDMMKSAMNALKKTSSAAQLMIKKSLLERGRKQKFQHLGELAYSLHKANALKSEELKQMIKEIDDINKEIRKTSSELGTFSPKKKCERMGTIKKAKAMMGYAALSSTLFNNLIHKIVVNKYKKRPIIKK